MRYINYMYDRTLMILLFVILLGLMDKLESVQYSAARAIRGIWKGTSRDKLYTKLGWESLNCRKWSTCLTLVYKIINNLTPAYTKDPIPPLPQSHYILRNQDVVGYIRTRTETFRSFSFYPHCLSKWNGLDPGIRLVPSVGVLKKKLLSIIRPPVKSSLAFTILQAYRTSPNSEWV